MREREPRSTELCRSAHRERAERAEREPAGKGGEYVEDGPSDPASGRQHLARELLRYRCLYWSTESTRCINSVVAACSCHVNHPPIPSTTRRCTLHAARDACGVSVTNNGGNRKQRGRRTWHPLGRAPATRLRAHSFNPSPSLLIRRCLPAAVVHFRHPPSQLTRPPSPPPDPPSAVPARHASFYANTTSTRRNAIQSRLRSQLARTLTPSRPGPAPIIKPTASSRLCMPTAAVAMASATTPASTRKTGSAPEKKYKCQFCNRAFSRSEHRSRHERSRKSHFPSSLSDFPSYASDAHEARLSFRCIASISRGSTCARDLAPSSILDDESLVEHAQ